MGGAGAPKFGGGPPCLGAKKRNAEARARRCETGRLSWRRRTLPLVPTPVRPKLRLTTDLRNRRRRPVFCSNYTRILIKAMRIVGCYYGIRGDNSTSGQRMHIVRAKTTKKEKRVEARRLLIIATSRQRLGRSRHRDRRPRRPRRLQGPRSSPRKYLK